jgi:phage-related protein
MARNVALDVLARDRAAGTFDKVADAADRAARRINRTAKMKIEVDGDAIESSARQAASRIPQIFGNTLGSLPPQVQGAILAGVVGAAALLAPLIGAAINAGVLLGLGGGALAVGIALALKDPAVNQAFIKLGERAKKAIQPFVEPFKFPLIQAADTIGDSIERLAPALGRIGAAVAPFIEPLVTAFTMMAETAMPGIEAAIKASAPLFDVLAGSLIEMGPVLRDFFLMMAKGAPGAALALEHLMKVIGFAITATGALILGLSVAYKGIVDGIRAAGNFLSAAWDKITQGASAAWNWIKGVGQSIADAWSGTKDGAGSAVDWLTGKFTAFKDFLAGLWQAITTPVISAWNTVYGAISTVVGAIVGFFQKWWPLLFAIVSPVIFAIVALWNHFGDTIIGAAQTVWGYITGFLSATWETIKTLASGAWEIIKNYIIGPILVVAGALVVAWNTVTGFLVGVWNTIKGAASTAWNGIKSAVVGPATTLYNQVRDLFNKAKGAITSALDSAWNTVKDIGSKFSSIGKNIVDGIVNGVKGAASRLYNTLKDLANGALNAAKKALGIASPSKKMAALVGDHIPTGVAVGVTRKAGIAYQAVRSMARGLIDAAGAPQLAMAGGASGLSVPGGMPAAPRGGSTFNIYTQRASGYELAREIDWELRGQGA